MALFPVLTNPRWRPPPSWIISNGHISQQLTIYLYSAHHAVIFAIAQLSCLYSSRVIILVFILYSFFDCVEFSYY